jgi:hypothetical protein
MLDPNMLILGTSAATLVSGFLAKSVEEFGKKTAGAAWDKASEIFRLIKLKLSGDPQGQTALTALEAAPGDAQAREHVASAIAETASKDGDFAKELSSKLVAAAGSGVDNVFNTNIAGSVEKLVQIQNVYGNVSL